MNQKKENFTKENRMLAIFKALANSNRIKMLRLINNAKDGSLSVNEIAEQMKISQPAISLHLKVMRIQKIVRARQDGLNMFYSISEPLVAQLISQIE